MSDPTTPHRRWHQFSLGTMMVVMAACAVATLWPMQYRKASIAREKYNEMRSTYEWNGATAQEVCEASKALWQAESKMPFSDGQEISLLHLQRVAKIAALIISSAEHGVGDGLPDPERDQTLDDVRAYVREAKKLYADAGGESLSPEEVEALAYEVPVSAIYRVTIDDSEKAATHESR